jgi:MFS family permease
MLLITAASIAVFKETDSATAVSLLLGLAALPTVVLGPLAGTFADWFSRKRMMIIADIASAAACLVAVLASMLTRVEVAAFLSVAIVAALSSFYRPAAQALLPTLAGKTQLERANSGIRLATSLAAIIGPATAGLLVGKLGFEVLLLLDAATFVASALLIVGITKVPPMPAVVRRSAFADSMEGLRYARRHPRLRIVIGAIGVTLLVGTIVNAGTLALVSRVFALPESRYGLLLAIEGAGAMALAVLFLYLGPRIRLLPTGSAALIAVGASTVMLGSSPNLQWAAIAIAIQGMAVVALQVAFASYIQQQAADAFRGRVMALTGMVASLASLAGFGVAGFLVDGLGVRESFTLAGLVICVASVPVVALAWRAAREARALAIA